MRNQNVPFNKNLLVAHLLLHLLLNDCHNWFYVRHKKSGLGRSVSVGECVGMAVAHVPCPHQVWW